MDTGYRSRWQTYFCDLPWRLDVQESPHVGAHVIAKRAGYTHHGVYVGNGRVVHYAGLSRVWLALPVEEVSLEEFAQGRAVWVQPHPNPRFTPEEIVTRARSRLGEDDYRIASNNCEHFCEWCVQGQSRSRQIDSWTRKPQHVGIQFARAVVRWFRHLLPLDPWNDKWAI